MILDFQQSNPVQTQTGNLAGDLAQVPLARASAWLVALLRSAMDAIIIMDSQRRIVLLNNEAERLFGLPAAQLLGQSMDALLAGGSRGRFRRAAGNATSRQRLQLDGIRGGVRFRFDASLCAASDGIDSFVIASMQECAPLTLAGRRRAMSSQQAYELEKRRVSRELYDELCQRLSVLKLDMDWLEKSLPADAKVSPERISHMQALLDSVILRTKSIASGLRPPLLDDFGLLAAVRWIAHAFEKRTSIQCEVSSNVAAMAAGEAVDSAVYRVVQECLLNIERHAQASHVRITMQREGGRLEVLVRDDGIGMPSGCEYKPGCFGLVAMQERIYTLGGNIDIHSKEQQGSEIHVTIPIEPLAARMLQP
jgi:PAS domain S-box-containing protein